jgi:hypothetical protein
MANPACEDSDAIRKSLMRLRRLCFSKRGLSTTECWCYQAREDGGHIDCTEARQPTAMDLIGVEK